MNKKKTTLLILAALFALLLAGAGLLYARLGDHWTPGQQLLQSPGATQTQDTTAPAASGSAADKPTGQLPLAPDFTVYDAQGNEAKLSDFFGKPIVLNFWASWCGPCRSEMPAFEQAFLEQGEDIQFLMVNMTSGRETLDSATEFIGKSGYTFPVYYDTSGEAAYIYGVHYLPTTYFIDAEGYAVAMATSAMDAQLLRQGMDMITQDK